MKFSEKWLKSAIIFPHHTYLAPQLEQKWLQQEL